MNVLIIYESLTGNTKRMALTLMRELRDRGATATACPTTNVDYGALAASDLVVIGGWVDGVFVMGQRPGRSSRLRGMPVMKGKRAIVYCTYALDPGKVLEKMTHIVEGLGAEVIGGLAVRRNDLDGGAEQLAESIVRLVSA